MAFLYPHNRLLAVISQRYRRLEEFFVEIYNAVKGISLKKGISIYKLEKNLGYPNGSISKWNRQIPNAVRLQEVADYLGVTSSYILSQSRKER